MAAIIFLLMSFEVLGATDARVAFRFAPRGPTPVVYFGGNQASAEQVDSWSEVAQTSPKYGSSFKFEGHSLHGADSNEGDVLRASAAEIQGFIRAIDSPGFKGPIVLMGHSDGSWVASAIAGGVKELSKKKIRLVIQDGHAPHGPAFAHVNLQCWTSYMSEKQPSPPKSCRDIAPAARSLSTEEMAKCRPGSCRMLPQTGCTTKWCLHFRLINRNVPTGLRKDDHGSMGYDRLLPQLSFLDPFLSIRKPRRREPIVRDVREVDVTN